MSNNKQSSLEWFLDELIKNGYLKRLPVIELQQAKAMHEKEIINAVIYGDRFEGCYGLDAEQYYNETFGGNNEQE